MSLIAKERFQMSLFGRLFGGKSSAPAGEPEIYEDMQIFAEPMAEGKSIACPHGLRWKKMDKPVNIF